jgi:hypothetical protein
VKGDTLTTGTGSGIRWTQVTYYRDPVDVIAQILEDALAKMTPKQRIKALRAAARIAAKCRREAAKAKAKGKKR